MTRHDRLARIRALDALIARADAERTALLRREARIANAAEQIRAGLPAFEDLDGEPASDAHPDTIRAWALHEGHIDPAQRVTKPLRRAYYAAGEPWGTERVGREVGA